MRRPRRARRARPLRWSQRAAAPQELLCAHRGECLLRAARAGWSGFACSDCPDAAPLSAAELVADHPGLVALAHVVVHPPGAYPPWGKQHGRTASR